MATLSTAKRPNVRPALDIIDARTPEAYPLGMMRAIRRRATPPGGHPERWHQVRTIRYLRARPDIPDVLIIHPRNETPNRRRRQSGAAEGVTPGVADVLVLVPFRMRRDESWRPGLIVEIKASYASAVTRDQIDHIVEARRVGWIAEVCVGVGEAQLLIEACYGMPGAMMAALAR